MLNLSMNDFDKAFWVSSTNMRNLMRAAINIDINVGNVEDNVSQIGSEIDGLKDSADLATNPEYGIVAIWNTIVNLYEITEDLLELIQSYHGGGSA